MTARTKLTEGAGIRPGMLSRIRQEFEANRGVLRDVVPTLAARVFVIVCGLASSIIMAKVLGPEGRGEYFYIVTLAQLAMQVGNLGLGSSNTSHRGPGADPRFPSSRPTASGSPGTRRAWRRSSSCSSRCRSTGPTVRSMPFLYCSLVPSMIYGLLASAHSDRRGSRKRVQSLPACQYRTATRSDRRRRGGGGIGRRDAVGFGRRGARWRAVADMAAAPAIGDRLALRRGHAQARDGFCHARLSRDDRPVRRLATERHDPRSLERGRRRRPVLDRRAVLRHLDDPARDDRDAALPRARQGATRTIAWAAPCGSPASSAC